MIAVEFEPTFEAWRAKARELLRQDAAPERVLWNDASLKQEALFSPEPPISAAAAPVQSVPKEFMTEAAAVACHRDPARWDLLYRILYRLTHGERDLLKIEVDADTHLFRNLAKSVRRDMHKMKAFVRFRRVERGGIEDFVAWHQPDHFIVERLAPWFVDRFGSMRWSILTPDRSAYWDMQALRFGPGVPRSEAPEGDALEELWKSYYASIFNPARLMVKAMKSEMAVRYWHTLPEAELIPG